MNMQQAAEEIGISVEAYRSLCSLFLKTTKNDLQTLYRAVEEEKRETISEQAHHIKGAASNMEFDKLMEEAEKLNKAAADAPVSELKRHAEKINMLFVEIEAVLGDAQ
ncbi:MAG: Hpt domain-containing protein [Spirochaetaceae bacterium]